MSASDLKRTRRRYAGAPRNVRRSDARDVLKGSNIADRSNYERPSRMLRHRVPRGHYEVAPSLHQSRKLRALHCISASPTVTDSGVCDL